METCQSFGPRRDLIHSFFSWHEETVKNPAHPLEEIASRETRFPVELARVVTRRCNQNLLLDFYLSGLVKWG